MDQLTIRASDLRQFVYCPRVVYYRYCVPVRPPPTYKMVEGKRQHEREEELEQRRGLHAYGLSDGERHFDVWLASDRLGLTGTLDMVILRRHEVIPVEFKQAQDKVLPETKVKRRAGIVRVSAPDDQDKEERPTPATPDPVDLHHKYQLAAYALLAEERWQKPARRCFVYLVSLRRALEVDITDGARRYVNRLLREMRRMILAQAMPDGTRQIGRCRECEYLRFCNDVDFLDDQD
ncbi:MAG: Dna2/Cas4 domain-containing protein [Chloroflexi bacterium]|nr:Dna2/Cas4 domain-containing protein [Chloroflexota bacterium]